MSLGLTYGVVELVEHAADWHAAFVAERARLAAALPADCAIEHVGSTAVPGLVAKPILDIAIGMSEAEPFEAIRQPLERLGYLYRGDAGDAGGHVFVRESTPRVRTHHVHAVRRDEPQWAAYLTFRDYLRASPAARQAYADAKRELAQTFAADRKAYSAAKQTIVERLLGETRR